MMLLLMFMLSIFKETYAETLKLWHFPFDFQVEKSHVVAVVVVVKVDFVVHDRIYNSVADYNSLRVGVGCMYDCMSDVPFHFHNGITSQRFELEG